MGKLKIEDASYTIGVNVVITKRDVNTGAVLEERRGHNRCLRLQLMGIAKWLNGEFNDTQPYMLHYDWIPRYLAVGTNQGSTDSGAGITSNVSVNDTRLLDEISPRLKLPDRHTIINSSKQSYIQLVISTYLPKELYNNQVIREAGLFSKASGNNCLFRITFDPITKTEDSVVEINWTISVISVDSQNEPYEEDSKEDLLESMKRMLKLYGEKYPKLLKSTGDMYEAIQEFGKADASEGRIQELLQLLGADYAQLVKDTTP